MIQFFYSNDPVLCSSFLFLPLALSDDLLTPELRGPASDKDCCCTEVDCVGGSTTSAAAAETVSFGAENFFSLDCSHEVTRTC
jgi:hypothetical protein